MDFKYCINFLLIIIILLAGDVEKNPGPTPCRRRQCRMLYSNIRGLNANKNDLIAASRQFDIVFCSETLVSNFRSPKELLIPDYKEPHLLKRNQRERGQGMAAYIRKGFPASRKAIYECDCHEVLVLKLSGKHNNFYMFSIYRNPDANDDIYDCLCNSMASIQEDDRKAAFLFVGDFNAHHREWLNSTSPTDRHGLSALDFATQCGCEQLIKRPTHRSGNTLDLIFTDVPGVVSGNVGTPIGTSDHSFVSAIIRTEQIVPEVTSSRKIYLKSQGDWDGVRNDIKHLDWSNLYRQDDVIESFTAACLESQERRIPSRVVTFRNKDKAWFNYDCKRAYLDKQEAYKLWRRNRSELTWNNYVRLRSEAQEVYAVAEMEYNRNIKDTLLGATQSHKWWSTFKSALFGIDDGMPPLLKSDGSLTHCPREKATLLANVFEEKQSDTEVTLPQSCHPEAKLISIAFRSREIEKLMLNLDPYGGSGPDGIFPLFFIKTADILAPKIAVIFRKMTRAGKFSLLWRMGNITPTSKSVTAGSCPSDYRPISITPILSKIYERLLAKRLSAYAECNNLFPCQQFGFRKGLGACDAVLTISDRVQKALDSGSEARMIGLDFSAAFDRVNHKALIYKLRQLGIGGSFLKILTEFLTDRKQRVVVDGHYGEWRNVISGVPQGSVLGPLLFILFTQDMWVGLENQLVAYADDATLIAVVPSPDQRQLISESLNRDLARISAWCSLWGMKLNPTKTQSMIASRSRTPFPRHPDLLLNNVVLNACDSFKILGVLFDSKFTFEQHVRSISSSVAQKIGLLRKSRKMFGNPDVVRKCFNSFILPCLEYCSPAWSSAAASHLKLLDKNVRACKFLIPDLEVDLWHRRSVSSLCLLYKVFHNPKHPLNTELPNLFQAARVTRNTLNANSLAFTVQRYNTSQYSRCFIPATTRLWNELPSSIVESQELQKFKTGANAFLLSQ